MVCHLGDGYRILIGEQQPSRRTQTAPGSIPTRRLALWRLPVARAGCRVDTAAALRLPLLGGEAETFAAMTRCQRPAVQSQRKCGRPSGRARSSWPSEPTPTDRGSGTPALWPSTSQRTSNKHPDDHQSRRLLCRRHRSGHAASASRSDRRKGAASPRA